MKTQLDSIKVLRQTIDSYRNLIDKTLEQLTDEELVLRPSSDVNSVAVILRHLGGNLVSRWTDFLTTDGEKETRNRDREFEDWNGTRSELLAYFNEGWSALVFALETIDQSNIDQEITIRGEKHTVLQAAVRSVTHITYHAGQIALVARLVHKGDWQWLTIAPNQSKDFNRDTWGTSKSRAVFDADDDSEPT